MKIKTLRLTAAIALFVLLSLIFTSPIASANEVSGHSEQLKSDISASFIKNPA